MTETTFKAAVVQAGSLLFDTPATLRKLATLTREAARRGASLVVFPEAFVGGYPKGLDFGAKLGSRTAEGRDDFRRYFEGAIEVPGEATGAIGEAARENAVHLVVGVVERGGATLYCTALMFAPDGKLLAKHRKVMPTGLERLVWGFGDGSTLAVCDTQLGKLGSVICWESYMPLLRTAMYGKGIELYCAPTADDRDTWLPTVRTIALEGRCFVFSVCQYLTSAAFPEDHPARTTQAVPTVLMRGGSCIVGPLGEVLAPPSFEGECIAVAEIDRSHIARGKFDLDVVGHYARPDIFHLEVDETPKMAVTLRRNSDDER